MVNVPLIAFAYYLRQHYLDQVKGYVLSPLEHPWEKY